MNNQSENNAQGQAAPTNSTASTAVGEVSFQADHDGVQDGGRAGEWRSSPTGGYMPAKTPRKKAPLAEFIKK